MHALFKLESGFNLNNGGFNQDGMFNRQAYVGLQSDQFGTVTLGRQYDSMVDFLGPLSEAGAGYGNNLSAHPFDNDNLDNSFSIKNSVISQRELRGLQVRRSVWLQQRRRPVLE